MALGLPLFELENVSKNYGDTAALKSVDLVVPRGCCTVLIGPSGCGKSTILRLLLRLTPPDAGQIHFQGRLVSELEVHSFRRQIGYVVQGGGLFPHLSAERNVTLLARFLGWPAQRISARLAELRELTKFSAKVLSRYPVELSGGQAQRVSLMRGLMLDPETLLLDEPLGALDPITRFDLQQDLQDIFDRLRKTVVLVTHDLAEAAFFGQHIALMRSGGIVQRGAVQELIHSPVDPFVAQFVRAQRSPMDSLGSKT